MAKRKAPATKTAKADPAEAVRRLAARYPWPAKRPAAEPNGGGWFPPEAGRLMERFWPAGGAVYLEVGTWFGMSTRSILHGQEGSVAVCVDWWRGDKAIFKDGELRDVFPVFCATNWHLRDRIVPVRAKTVEGMEAVAAAGVVPSLIFIDADHEYEAVAADLAAALRLWPGVPIVGDDWWIHFPGVERAVSEAVAAAAGRLELHREGRAWALTVRK